MNEQTNELAVTNDRSGAMTVRAQVNQIQYLMKDVLKEGEHYGLIPGVQKPSLMQSGAEKIGFMFNLVPHYKIQMTPIDGMPGHREYMVTCTLTGPDGNIKGEAVASCSTMESKYRWRDGYEDTGNPIPQDARDRKQEYRKQGFGMKKVNGNWIWVRYIDRQENPDIADTWNTVMQMAEKRAFVRAIRSTTAASDIFTQDVEDLPPQYVDTVYEVPQVSVSEPPQVQQTQGPSEQDKAELRRLTNECVALGYEERSTAKWLYEQYKQGGIDYARERAESLMTAKIPDIADEDIEF